MRLLSPSSNNCALWCCGSRERIYISGSTPWKKKSNDCESGKKATLRLWCPSTTTHRVYTLTFPLSFSSRYGTSKKRSTSSPGSNKSQEVSRLLGISSVQCAFADLLPGAGAVICFCGCDTVREGQRGWMKIHRGYRETVRAKSPCATRELHSRIWDLLRV